MTYIEFLQNIINTRGQWNAEIRKTYCERHHIIPRCKGGLPEVLNWQHHENIIWLTAREHFIAHQLLTKENPNDYALVNAWLMMAFPKGDTKRDYKITAEEYEELRILVHNVKVGKNFVPRETQLAVGKLNKEYAAKRTKEEKTLIAAKKLATLHSNYTEEELKLLQVKKGEKIKAKSKQEKEQRKAKYLATWNKKTSEELQAHKLASARPGELNGAWGKHWYHNSQYRIFTTECPEGFIPGKGPKGLKSWKEIKNENNEGR